MQSTKSDKTSERITRSALLCFFTSSTVMLMEV
jgi:hypothetical protein